MAIIRINGFDHYYELAGQGPALVLLHGAFCDGRMWDAQWEYFTSRCRVLRYDLRGHGRTGASDLEAYSLETFADDLFTLLEALEISRPVVCGQSFGGSIAQAFAVRHPQHLRGLILSGSMVAIDLTLTDKILCRVVVPRWMMLGIIRLMNVEQFTRFSIALGKLTKGKEILGGEHSFDNYLEECMLQIPKGEYLKLWRAMYGFRLLPLERLTCPVLVLNGEHEPGSLLPHSREVLRRIPHARAAIVPDAHHGTPMENPQAFNHLVEDFLRVAGQDGERGKDV